MQAIVEEEPEDARPHREGGLLRAIHGVHDVLRHRRVEPRGDTGVNLHPLDLILHQNGIEGVVDVIGEAELLEGGVKECSPLAKVRLVHVEHDRNMSVDVDLDNGGGCRWWFGSRGCKGIGGA
jgi:hypothetical protein